jgi:hypothetical protein
LEASASINPVSLTAETNPISQLPDKTLRERKRLSAQARQLVAEYLDRTYGHKCSLCPATERLEQDHVNGDPSDNRLVNFRWLCKPCNLAARRLIPSAGEGERERQNEDQIASAEVSINRDKEPAWRKWLFARVSDNKPCYTEDAIYAGAEAVGCNPQTTRRYLGKVISSAGIYTTVKVSTENRTLKQVVFK